jgi:hypothetical protein
LSIVQRLQTTFSDFTIIDRLNDHQPLVLVDPDFTGGHLCQLGGDKCLYARGAQPCWKNLVIGQATELSASDLQQLTNAYTVQNWQDSQPSHLLFVPIQ